MKNSNIKVIIAVVLFGSFPAIGQQVFDIQTTQERSRETGYLYAFSEATKMFIFGDYGRAANLYRECLKYEPESGAVHYQLAELYLKAGDLEMADQFSRKAYFFSPENKWIAIQRANILQAEQKYDSAIIIYKTLLNGTDSDMRVYFLLASLLEKKGSFQSAMDYLNEIERKAGITRETALGKSRIYDRMGRKDEALAQFRLALSGREEDYIIYGMMAEFYSTHQIADSAEFYYKKVIGDHQEDENLMLSYGEFLLEQNRLSEARKLYAELFANDKIIEEGKFNYIYSAVQNQNFFSRLRPVMDTVVKVMIRKNPDDMRVMSIYSDVNYRLGEFDAAARMLRRIIAKDENNFAAWEQLIFCESAMDKPDSVIFYGEQAISRFDKRPLAYLLVSSVYYTKKEYSKAIGLLRQGEVLAETDRMRLEFYSLLAECYGKTENADNSDQYYERALLIDSLNVAILNNYAYSLAERGQNIEKAESMSRYTVVMEPVNATYLDTYAWIKFKGQSYKEALKYIKKAIRFGGDENGEVLGHYGDILLKRGKSKRALDAYKDALRFADMDLKAELNSKINDLANPRL